MPYLCTQIRYAQNQYIAVQTDLNIPWDFTTYFILLGFCLKIFCSLYCTPIILKSLSVLLHPQCNKRNNITIFLQKKKKNLKELFSKCHSQMMVTTESLFNIVYIITYTKKSTYKLKLIKTYLLIVIYLIRKGLISILNEVNEKVKGGLVSSCKIANLWYWIPWTKFLLLHSKIHSFTAQPHPLKEVFNPTFAITSLPLLTIRKGRVYLL